MSHATLSPSSADRWTTCPGSVRLSKGMPDSSGEAAREGTAAHDLLERCINTDNSPLNCIGTKVKGGEQTFVVTEDMANAVNVAYEYVKSVTNAGVPVFTERKVDPGSMMGRTDIEGTADITIMYGGKLTVLDYKHGRGILVEAPGNLQTLLYGIGALASLEPESRVKIKTIETGIIQPRIEHPDGPIRLVSYPIEDIYKWIMWFSARAAATDNQDAELIQGKKQCQWCRAKAVCPKLKKKTLDVFSAVDVRSIEPQVLRDPETLTMEEINLIDDNASIIEGFIKAVKSYKRSEMMRGVDFPGYKLVNGKPGNRKFTEEQDKLVSFLSRNFGLKKAEVTTEPKLLGPAKILTKVKKAEKGTAARIKKLESMIERPVGKLEIAHESDQRPAAQTNLQEVFKDVPKLDNDNQEIK